MAQGTKRRRRALIVVILLVLAGVVFASQSGSVNATGYQTIDGQFSGTGPINGGTSFALKVTGRGGVPETGVGAVAINVAVTNATHASYLTAYPTGADRPTAANLVFVAGQTVPNMVIVKVGDGGQISLFNYAGDVDVVVDVQGWFPADNSFTGLTPARVMDTRAGYPTIDGQFAGGGSVGPNGTLNLTVTNRGGVPASGVGTVALNVTVTNPTASSYVTVFPTGASKPNAANLNFPAGGSVQNLVLAKVGAGGQVSLYNLAGTADVIVDVLGWFPDTGSFTGLVPNRMMDTRIGGETGDGQFAGIGAAGPGAVINMTVTGRLGVPGTGVAAVAINVAAVAPSADSFLTVYPAGAERPLAANLNFVRNQTIPNLVIVKVGAAGQVSFYNYAGSTDIVVDVAGWFPDTGGYQGLTPARLMDSRTDTPPPGTSTSTTSTLNTGPTTTAAPTSTVSTTTTTAPGGTTSTTVGNVGDVKPGAFCAAADVGQLGTHNGATYVCSYTNSSGVPYSDGHSRWRPV